jgi:hypothetical protein
MLQDWAKAKFATNFRPSSMSSNAIAELWWSWWLLLNAPTRITSADNQLIPGAEGASIETVKLRAPGKYGWLGLLYSLMVWREWLGDGEKKDWEDAVLDVYSVTRRLCELSYYCPTAEFIPTLKRYVFFKVFLGILILISFLCSIRTLNVLAADPTGGRSKRARVAAKHCV